MVNLNHLMHGLVCVMFIAAETIMLSLFLGLYFPVLSDNIFNAMKPSGIIVVFLFLSLLSGCVYMNIQRPLDSDFDRTEVGLKEGRAEFHSVLWLFAWGNGGTKAAAENGGIKVIRHADTRVLSVLFGLYTRVTTIVYGD